MLFLISTAVYYEMELKSTGVAFRKFSLYFLESHVSFFWGNDVKWAYEAVLVIGMVCVVHPEKERKKRGREKRVDRFTFIDVGF